MSSDQISMYLCIPTYYKTQRLSVCPLMCLLLENHRSDLHAFVFSVQICSLTGFFPIPTYYKTQRLSVCLSLRQCAYNLRTTDPMFFFFFVQTCSLAKFCIYVHILICQVSRECDPTETTTDTASYISYITEFSLIRDPFSRPINSHFYSYQTCLQIHKKQS